MRQSIFKKEVSATGSQGTVKAEIICTMNYEGTLTSPIHKIEVFINNIFWDAELNLTSQMMVYNESERLINLAKEHCEKLANAEHIELFSEKMTKLFS